MHEDGPLLDLAAAVADGRAPTWGEVSSDEADLPVLEMQIIAEVARLYRERRLSPEQEATSSLNAEPPAGRSSADAAVEWGNLIILERLGAGAHGDVFRAWDPQLGREVALKLLRMRARESGGAEAVIREGQLLARVRHPNVMAVYGARAVDGKVGIWSEFLRGRTLAQIVRDDGPLGAQEALVLIDSVCSALAAAHRAGLLHRDVKAQNVMREYGGRVALMDFGLGRERDAISQSSGHEIAGTPLYLAPELFGGQCASVQSDIYSVGVLMFFLVTNSYPVLGGSLDEIVAGHRAGLRQRLRDLRPELPAAFVLIVERALDPDPRRRFESCGALQAALSAAVRPEGPPAWTEAQVPRPAWGRVALTALLASILAGSLAWWATRSQPKRSTPLTFGIAPPPGGRFIESSRNVGVVSPDGEHVAFVATDEGGTSRLWVRPFRSHDAIAIPDSDSATNPFWAPDGKQVAFFAREGLRRVSLGGVRSETIAPATENRGGSWSTQGVILVAPGPRQGLYRVNAAGGALEPVIAPDRGSGQIGFMWPQFLPDGHRFIHFVLSNDEHVRGVYLGSLSGEAPRRLLASDASAVFAGGYLFFVRDGDLCAQALDVSAGRLEGVPARLLQGVATTRAFRSAVDAADSVLVYSASGATDTSELRWYDRTGRKLGLIASAANYRNPALSADGRYLAVQQYRDTLSDLRVLDLQRGGSVRIAHAPTVAFPTWSAQGTLAFSSSDSGWLDIYVTSLGAKEKPKPLILSNSDKMPTGWSPDGRFLAYADLPAGGSYDLWVVLVEDPEKRIAILGTSANEYGGRFSPDGRWLAYVSSDSGHPEVSVIRFPGGTRSRPVSVSGGADPQWESSNRLSFLDPLGRLMEAEIPATDEQPISPPQVVFQTDVVTPTSSRNHYAWDGASGRLVLNNPVALAGQPRLAAVVNWAELLSK
jgi:serine/threonine protein kinase/Tol biopolymer transport system component